MTTLREILGAPPDGRELFRYRVNDAAYVRVREHLQAVFSSRHLGEPTDVIPGRLRPTTTTEVIALSSDTDWAARTLRHHWPTVDSQRAVIQGLLLALGSPVDVRVLAPYEKKHTPHHRSLELAWTEDELEIRLDQGFGFLEAVPPADRFPFELGVDAQVSKLLGGSWRWEAPALKVEIPAYILRPR